MGFLGAAVLSPVDAAESRATEVPLVVGYRTIHVFRAPLAAFSAEERADGARHRIASAFEGSGEGWTSIKPVDAGILVELDGKPMFTVAEGDARKLAGETTEELANRASRALQKAWAESRERRDLHASLMAALRVLGALLILAIVLIALVKIGRVVGGKLTRHLAGSLERLSAAGAGARVAALCLGIAARSFTVLTWAIGLMAAFLFLSYALTQFAFSRPMGDEMTQSLVELLSGASRASASALPGLFVAVMVFMAARVTTQVSSGLFDQIAAGHLRLGVLDAQTAPATRRIVNAAVWIFALAMAYPYLPGAQTEAFKGISVILGIMVSIGASGLMGQIASGMILVYTRALLIGEYVRIQDCEGTVTNLGLFVTRLRTGMGEEITLPNSLVLANVTRNFSRVTGGHGFVIDITVTIGYDTPWRQVHAMLLEAAGQVPQLLSEPAPYVVQTALSDFYVAYRLVVQSGADSAMTRARISSDLHAAIQDTFNKYGVQIMSPHYLQDPHRPKVVPPGNWYSPPAAGREPKS
jgi:small-conductance mechanosensitive channel